MTKITNIHFECDRCGKKVPNDDVSGVRLDATWRKPGAVGLDMDAYDRIDWKELCPQCRTKVIKHLKLLII